METIEIFSKEEKEETIRAARHMIERARRLNIFYDRTNSKPKPGTEFLQELLEDDVIDNRMYEIMKRVSEDPTIEYEIKL